MIIESIIRRANGTIVDLGGETYHFKPRPGEERRHLAIVLNPVHQARFLSIPEGYRELKVKAELLSEANRMRAGEVALAGVVVNHESESGQQSQPPASGEAASSTDTTGGTVPPASGEAEPSREGVKVEEGSQADKSSDADRGQRRKPGKG